MVILNDNDTNWVTIDMEGISPEDKVLFFLLTMSPSFYDKTQFCSVLSIAY